MNLLNLFDGIGGFALAAEWMGWNNVASCEIDPFCRRVLDYHFKYEYIYEDIKQADFTGLRGRIDLITGGFPCQPFSLAGKQQGTDDNRYLFPEMFRAIREVRPRWIVAENVRGLVTQQGGLVFEQVCADLESAGYEVQPFILPACAVNAPHRRDRVWIVAHRADTGIKGVQGREKEILPAINVADPDGNGNRAFGAGGAAVGGRRGNDEQPQERRITPGGNNGLVAFPRDVTDTERFGGGEIRDQIQSKQSDGKRADGIGDERASYDTERNGRNTYEVRSEMHVKSKGKSESHTTDSTQGWWREFPTEPPVCSGDDGLSDRLDGITFPKWREESIKAFGNAVVPPEVLQIFMAIDEYERSIR